MSPTEPSIVLVADQAVLPDRVLAPAALRIDRPRGPGPATIGAIATAVDRLDVPNDVETVELGGTLLPGPIDLQVNGAGGRGVDEASADALETVARAVRAGGATAFLPTLITAPFDALLDQVRAVAAWITATERDLPADCARPLGIHVEGPFLEAAGAHDEAALIDPTPERVDALLAAGDGHLALVTLASSRTGAAAAVARLVAANVRVSIGHVRSVDGFGACVDAGARLVTHLFNAMSPLHHRAPGIVGHAFDDERLTCCLILDGHHVDPAVARTAWRVLGPDRCVLVSDCVSAMGMPDGEYALSGMPVRRDGPVVRDRAGNLAGSAISMRDAARGFREFVPDAGDWTLARVLATNAARVLDVDGAGGCGALAVGHRAEFAVRNGERLDVVDLSSPTRPDRPPKP